MHLDSGDAKPSHVDAVTGQYLAAAWALRDGSLGRIVAAISS